MRESHLHFQIRFLVLYVNLKKIVYPSQSLRKGKKSTPVGGGVLVACSRARVVPLKWEGRAPFSEAAEEGRG